jgi:hypothetical protein
MSSLIKGSAISAIALAICLMANGARAESYPSDAPNAGVSQAKAKERPVKVTPKLYVVHPQVDTSTSRKRGK